MEAVQSLRLQGEGEQQPREAQGHEAQHQLKLAPVPRLRPQGEADKRFEQAHQAHAHVQVKASGVEGGYVTIHSLGAEIGFGDA